ncbi:MAG: FIST C-terminal domain-containing protein [Campylobacteraceae bacterium]|nr:FIST C-terminal domain-containing protein [Campylobacteraceae bacterium]
MKTYNYTFSNNNLRDLIDYSLFKNEKNILVQIFCGHEDSTLQLISNEIMKNLPQSLCIGTTTDGEISNAIISTLKTVISISVFENTTLKGHLIEGLDAFQNGIEMSHVISTSNTKLIITFTDGTDTNAEEYLNGFSFYDKNLMIAGGMAGDNGVFKKTFISFDNKIINKGAVAISLNSDVLEVKNAQKFDWIPIGIEHRIDKMNGNRVCKISGMTAQDFYTKYLGKSFVQAEYPLIVKRNGVNLARAVLSKYDDGSLGCGGNLYEGDKVRLGFANSEMLMQNPIECLKDINEFKTETFFIYSCMARRRYMQNLIKIETEPFAKIAPTAGFFTYSEFFHNTSTNQAHNELLNQSLTLVALSENSNDLILTKERKQFKRDFGYNQLSFIKTTKSLTSLIQQSTQDYIEQSKKLEKEKLYSQSLLKSQKEFLRHAVHETNTPLSVIMSNIELFEMKHGKNDYLSNIEIALKNIVSIYDDLSYLVKKDHIQYVKYNIDLVDYTRARIDFFTAFANKKRSRIIFNTNTPSMIIFFNETKLQRIIDNNITNAIKYSFDKENINVTLEEDKDIFKFIVSSHSNKILYPQKVFEEYYREEKSKDGFGLGLNLVKRICEEENVNILLESNEKITTFTYEFNKGK